MTAHDRSVDGSVEPRRQVRCGTRRGNALDCMLVDDDSTRATEFVRTLRQAGVRKVAWCKPDALDRQALASVQAFVVSLRMRRHDAMSVLEVLAERQYTGMVILTGVADARARVQVTQLAHRLGLDVVCLGPGEEARQLATLDGSLECRLPSRLSETSPDSEEIDHSHLLRALALGQLEIHYQPQLTLSIGRVESAEALLRWRRSDGRLLSAGSFIHLLDRDDVCESVSTWTMRRCLDDVAWLRSRGLPTRIALNFDVRFLTSPLGPRTFIEEIVRRGLSPGDVVIEVTETSAAHDERALAEALTRLHLRGVTLSIDDFGKGFSSLDRLLRLPFQELKLDHEVVRRLGVDSGAAETIGACVELAHANGARVVAEGVETPEQLEALRALRCDACQGYLIGRPVELGAFTDVLQPH